MDARCVLLPGDLLGNGHRIRSRHNRTADFCDRRHRLFRRCNLPAQMRVQLVEEVADLS